MKTKREKAKNQKCHDNLLLVRLKDKEGKAILCVRKKIRMLIEKLEEDHLRILTKH